MERTKEDYLNLLNETIAYYSEDPKGRRANLVTGSCLYKTNDNRMCAVGRCLDQDKMDYEKYNHATLVGLIIKRLGDEVFKKEYQGFDTIFWKYLQNLHDETLHWDYVNLCLSDYGKEYAQFIGRFIQRKKFNLVVSN